MTTNLMLCSSSFMLHVAEHTTRLKEEWHLCQKIQLKLFLTFRNHFDGGKKTIYPQLEIKNFEVAGKILAEV